MNPPDNSVVLRPVGLCGVPSSSHCRGFYFCIRKGSFTPSQSYTSAVSEETLLQPSQSEGWGSHLWLGEPMRSGYGFILKDGEYSL